MVFTSCGRYSQRREPPWRHIRSRRPPVQRVTGLHLAAFFNFTQAALELCALNDINIDPKDILDKTPLLLAVTAGNTNTAKCY
jgi:ankyrin repeat protein